MEIKGRVLIAQRAGQARLRALWRGLAGPPVAAGAGFRAQLRGWLRLAVRLEPLLLLLLIPAVPVPQKLMYLGLVGPPVVWVCAWLAEGHFVRRTPLDWPLLILLAMAGLSQVIGLDPEYSLTKVTFVIWSILAFYTISRYVLNARRLRWALYGFLLLGGWMIAIGLFGMETPPVKLPLLSAVAEWLPDYITRLWGYSTNPNNLGAALAFFVPVQVALLLSAWQQRGRSVGWLPRFSSPAGLSLQAAALLLAAAILILSQSRAAYLGLVAALLSLAAWRVAKFSRAWAVVLVVGGTLFVSVAPHVYVVLTGMNTGDVASTESLLWRHAIWRDTLPLLADFPLAGVGVVRLREVLPALYPGAPISEFTLMMREAHNQYLEIGLSFGLPALAAYLALWVGMAHMTLRAHRAEPDPWVRALVEGLAAGLLANFVFGQTGSILLNAKVGICMWAALGLLAGAHQISTDSPAAQSA